MYKAGCHHNQHFGHILHTFHQRMHNHSSTINSEMRHCCMSSQPFLHCCIRNLQSLYIYYLLCNKNCLRTCLPRNQCCPCTIFHHIGICCLQFLDTNRFHLYAHFHHHSHYHYNILSEHTLHKSINSSRI